jgi:hypothetical protein
LSAIYQSAKVLVVWKVILELLWKLKKQQSWNRTWARDSRDGEAVTPLVEGRECAYVVFAADGTAQCGIELAWKAGATHFRKPVSCHLYPVRITKYKNFEAVNYHKWHICNPACELGRELSVPVYQFVREALIRKYGHEWFEKLKEASQQLEIEKNT